MASPRLPLEPRASVSGLCYAVSADDLYNVSSADTCCYALQLEARHVKVFAGHVMLKPGIVKAMEKLPERVRPWKLTWRGDDALTGSDVAHITNALNLAHLETTSINASQLVGHNLPTLDEVTLHVTGDSFDCVPRNVKKLVLHLGHPTNTDVWESLPPLEHLSVFNSACETVCKLHNMRVARCKLVSSTVLVGPGVVHLDMGQSVRTFLCQSEEHELVSLSVERLFYVKLSIENLSSLTITDEADPDLFTWLTTAPVKNHLVALTVKKSPCYKFLNNIEFRRTFCPNVRVFYN